MVSPSTALNALNLNQEMTDFNYKKYSLENLENWLHDALSSAEATPQEIYDVIKNVVDEQYHHHKLQASRCYELLALLNGNGKGHIEAYDAVMKEKEYYEPSMPPWGHSDLEYHLYCDKNDPSPECKSAWDDFWEETYCQEESNLHVTEDGDLYPVKDKVVKWLLPVEIDGPSGEYFICFPDDLLESANLKEGDQIEWVDNGDGSYTIRKVTKSLNMDEC